MVEIDSITLFEILIVFVTVIFVPIFIYFWRQNTMLTKMQSELIANDKLLQQKLDTLAEKFATEVESSNQQHARMESKIDDLCERVTRLEERK